MMISGIDLSLWMVIAALGGGTLAGFMYFGGLWWTVRRLPQSPSAAVLLLSYLVRTAAVMLIFILVVRRGWAYLLLAFLAFLLVRQLLIRYTDKEVYVKQ